MCTGHTSAPHSPPNQGDSQTSLSIELATDPSRSQTGHQSSLGLQSSQQELEFLKRSSWGIRGENSTEDMLPARWLGPGRPFPRSGVRIQTLGSESVSPSCSWRRKRRKTRSPPQLHLRGHARTGQRIPCFSGSRLQSSSNTAACPAHTPAASRRLPLLILTDM